ncbi:MAG: RlmE family RNA methyltransferase [Desulfovibrionaceae bacterium]|nr:RlmE family RNA methyltransferase [Desulfovibrionaceae bacterium]
MKKYRDHYFKKAKQEHYPARSVYKLQEIDKRFHVLGAGFQVLDLGAAPGSWTLWAARKVGPGGRVLAADIQATETQFPENAVFLQEDVFERSAAFQAELDARKPFDVVLSDMAPKTTGVKFADQARSLELAVEALAVAQDCLIKGGSFVVKIFMGPDDGELRAAMRDAFEAVKAFKPQSSRSESKEIFYVGLRFRGAGASAPEEGEPKPPDPKPPDAATGNGRGDAPT